MGDFSAKRAALEFATTLAFSGELPDTLTDILTGSIVTSGTAAWLMAVGRLKRQSTVSQNIAAVAKATKPTANACKIPPNRSS
jgi:hypothetical protein